MTIAALIVFCVAFGAMLGTGGDELSDTEALLPHRPDFSKLTHTNDPELLRKLYFDAAIRADERRIMCDEKDETIKRLTRRLQGFREAVWEHLIYPGDDGHTASGYGQEDIPDELLIDAIVDAS